MGRKKRPAKASSDSDAFVAWLREHTPLLATCLFLSLVVLRVLSTSQFDPATATTVIRTSGPLAISLGVLVTSLPQLLSATAFFLMIVARGGPGSPTQRRLAFTAVSVILLIITALAPWPQLLFTIAFLTGVFFFQGKFGWPLEFFAVIGLAVNLLLTVPDVWLPPEAITMSQGQAHVAYVLEVDSDWMTLLSEADRSVTIVSTEDVASREVCNLTRRTSQPTIYQLILGEKGGIRNPICSEVVEE